MREGKTGFTNPMRASMFIKRNKMRSFALVLLMACITVCFLGGMYTDSVMDTYEVVYDDYSDYTKSGDVEFLYYAVKDDDSTELKNVTVEVTPVADAPTINVADVTAYEDASNYNIKADGNKAEGGNKIPLGLKVPALSKDQTDKNGTSGDHPERNGGIY